MRQNLRNIPERDFFIDMRAGQCLLSRSGRIANRIVTPTEIGMIVRTIRKSQKLRQDELAGTAGVGVRFVVDLEAGKPTAQIGKALLILEALGCKITISPPPSGS